MKRIIYLTVIALMLMACSDSQYTNKYRYNDFIVQYKINKESSIGSIATVYGDRIYYFSDEQETPGIYSMDFNGNDVRCELEARDIQKIQIKDDILYYLTMEKVIYGSKGSQWGNRYYSLKSLDLKMGNTQSYDIIEEAVIKKKYSSDYRGIWDFYRMSEDRFIIANIQLSGHRQIFTVESNMIDESGDIYSFGEYKDVRRHIVGGANRTLFSMNLPPRLCRIGTCRILSAE